MPQKFYIRQGDTSPAIRATLKDANKAPIDLTGSTLKFQMKTPLGTTFLLNSSGSVISPTGGIAEYQWITGDTNTAGDMLASFEVTFPDGTIETYPNSENIIVKIFRQLV